MWLIAGLGNPGPKYALTRHNIGFMALDFLHRSLQSPPVQTDAKAFVSRFRWEGQDILTCQPQTFMNLSGESVQTLMGFYKISPENLIVVHDEIDLPFGKMKLQKNRSPGGHNGVKDISARLGTSDYIRLRLGVGRPPDPRFDVADYVLQKFSAEEMSALPDFLNKSCDALEAVIFQGLVHASNEFNR